MVDVGSGCCHYSLAVDASDHHVRDASLHGFKFGEPFAGMQQVSCVLGAVV